MNEKQLEYVIFCIENLAERCGTTGVEMHALLKKSALLTDYVIPSYAALHTQSKQYIVDDIFAVMRERGLVA